MANFINTRDYELAPLEDSTFMTTGGNQQPGMMYMTTGGQHPPTSLDSVNSLAPNTTMTMGGNQPPLVAPTMNTGGNLPPLVAPTMNTGGNLPATQAPLSIDGSRYVANLQPGAAPGSQFSATNVAMGSMDQILNTDSPLMRNARRRGLETANSRGVMNSSIAGGLSERMALEGAQPVFEQALALHRQRENLAFQGQENALNRVQTVNRDMLGAELTDWLGDRSFTREFNGALSMLPIKNSMDLTNAVSQYAMENPELYTPEVVSGMSNFFNRNALSILQTYFPSMLNTGGTG